LIAVVNGITEGKQYAIIDTETNEVFIEYENADNINFNDAIQEVKNELKNRELWQTITDLQIDIQVLKGA
jgi:hypothetical protein